VTSNRRCDVAGNHANLNRPTGTARPRTTSTPAPCRSTSRTA